MSIIYDVRINQDFKNESKDQVETYSNPTGVVLSQRIVEIPGVGEIHPKWLCDIALTWLEHSNNRTWEIVDEMGNVCLDKKIYYKNIIKRIEALL